VVAPDQSTGPEVSTELPESDRVSRPDVSALYVTMSTPAVYLEIKMAESRMDKAL